MQLASITMSSFPKKAEQAAKEKEEVEIQTNAMSYSKTFQERRSIKKQKPGRK